MSRLRGLRFAHLPTFMITGTKGKTTTSRLVAAILTEAGHTVGLVTTDGVSVAGKVVATGDQAGVRGHRIVLRDDRVTAAVLETARGGLKRNGLSMRPVRAAALLNVGYDHVGADGIATQDAMARLKARVADNGRHVVLNAEDARCLALAARYRPQRVTLFARRITHPALAAHAAAGGHIVGADDADVVVWRQAGHEPVVIAPLADMPVTLSAMSDMFIDDVHAAAALTLSIGVEPAAVRDGLVGFQGGREHNPGRLTFFNGHPFTLAVDRGFEASIIANAAGTVARFSGGGRRVAALSCVGNRPDEHLRRIGDVARENFDHVILYEEPTYRRGRAAGEIAGLLAEGLDRSGFPRNAWEQADDTEQAMARAIALGEPGGVVFLMSTRSDAVELVERILRDAQPGEGV
ncbi:Mur ligase family protein [Oricola sp.]|uniref:Mur ligase family protein n=1 Tax=Oricola sp. TaxID=1979950 RepID=UPI0025D7FA3A|nr:Mur ligase family protein [Oricola sp.]MCI5073663.1 Mur ligase family protein [Oricola sp.]